MQYLIAIYSNPLNWAHPTFRQQPGLSEFELAEMQREFDAMLTEITESGELVAGIPLGDPAFTRTVRVRGAGVAVTDGPFIESKEQLAGYFLVDCESIDRAAEIAARFPDARFAAVEVRPVMNLSDANGT
jgi:hypothetical protein